jgi:hypothetical protein
VGSIPLNPNNFRSKYLGKMVSVLNMYRFFFLSLHCAGKSGGDSKSNGRSAQVLCKYYTILYKGLEPTVDFGIHGGGVLKATLTGMIVFGL